MFMNNILYSGFYIFNDFYFLSISSISKEANTVFSPLVFFIKIIILILILIISLLIINKILSGRNENKTDHYEENPLTMKLHIKHPKENRIENISRFPVSIGFNNQNSLELPYLLPEKRSTGFTIIPAESHSIYRSVNPIIVNGVLRKKKLLREGDRITLQQYRIVYLGYNKKSSEIKKDKPYSIKFEATLLSIFIFMILFIPNSLLNINYMETEPELTAVIQNNSGDTSVIETSVPETGFNTEYHERMNLSVTENNNIGQLSENKYSFSKEIIKDPKIETIPPGTLPVFYKADMLFIHTHPDDESLDFGGLIAKASLSGKRIVVIIFTDGESGLDRFPARISGENYPQHKLTGSELSDVRIQECMRALSILGAETYIRLGLKNNPYTTIREEIGIDEMLKIWGGEEYLTDLLQKYIEGYRPDIIISPDIPSKAHEHFEHEVCGYIVKKTIEKIKNTNPGLIKAFLTSVDPLQKSFYPDAYGIDVLSPLDNGEIPRYIQLSALYQHVTQADASIIGIRVLSGFRKEFYNIVFWKLDSDIEEYIK